MNEPDAFQDEMPGFPFPGRPGGEHDEPLLDMIIARRALPPDAPQEMHDLARMLAALAGPAEPGELAAEEAVRAAFSEAASPGGVSSAARRPVRHRRIRRSRRPARSRVRLAIALAVAAVGLGGALAAYAGVLPSPIQHLADNTVAALTPHHSGSTGAATSGPGQTTVHRARAAKTQPAPTPYHSAVPAQAPSQTQFPRAHDTLRYPPPTGHPTAEPTCSPDSWRSHSPSDLGSPAPSWPPLGYCGSLPTTQPSARITLPLNAP